jgi:hypothetical protein
MSASAGGQGVTQKGEMPLFEARKVPNSSPCGVSRLSDRRQSCFEHHPEMFESSLNTGQRVLRALGLSAEEAQTVATRFKQHNFQLLEDMYPHHKDRSKLIAVAKQGRQQLEEQMARERAEARKPVS